MTADDYSESETVTVPVKVRVTWKRNTPGAREYAMEQIAPRQNVYGASVRFGCYSVEVIKEADK